MVLLDPVQYPGAIKAFAREVCRNDLLNFGASSDSHRLASLCQHGHIGELSCNEILLAHVPLDVSHTPHVLCVAGRLHFFFPDSRLALDLNTDKTLKVSHHP